jgi:uncharacterized hydrophobic protein (TIGR00271 family)
MTKAKASTKKTPNEPFSITLRNWLKELFNLSDKDKATERDTKEEIRKGIIFRGANLWILIFAILVCSVGLNVNSTAVIIGAMLISPIMGPIMGIGLGMGINDFKLIVTSSKNLGIALLMSVVASALYFWISPLDEVQSELLARTSPNFWDVLIAFFGGTAGIVAGSRKEKTNAVPGVAIATALMPPLCTAGYGLAQANWDFFFGALYLFFINCVFISLSTYMIVRLLRYRKKVFEKPERETKVKRYIALIVIATVIPSIYTAFNVVRKTVFTENCEAFIREEILPTKSKVISKNMKWNREGAALELTLYGNRIEDRDLDRIQSRFTKKFGAETKLMIDQGEDFVGEDDIASLKKYVDDYRSSTNRQLDGKDSVIIQLRSQLNRLKDNTFDINEYADEAKAIFTGLTEFTVSDNVLKSMEEGKLDTMVLAYAKFDKKVSKEERQKLENWIKVKTKHSSIKLIVDR